MLKYQIEATVEKIEKDEGNLVIRLRGCLNYCFEEINRNVYWNIFVDSSDNDKPNKPILKKQDDKIQVDNSIVTQHLLDHALIEKKKLKFELIFDSASDQFTIISISHASN